MKTNQIQLVLPRTSSTVLASLLVAAAIASLRPGHAQGAPVSYSFAPVAFLGDSAPGPEGGTFMGDFEPYQLNDRGEVGFAADLSTGGEGVFVAKPGLLKQIIRAGESAPGGGTFGGYGEIGFLGLNNGGDVAFCFGLDPLTFPIGANAGVYRYSNLTRTLSAIVVPNVTPAPGGGTFVGGDFYTSINNFGEVVFTGKITGADIDPTTPPGVDGLGDGVFRADASGHIMTVVRPGDPAPGGSVFDEAENPNINDLGDVAFDGHLAGEECINLGAPQSVRIVCGASVYLKPAAGAIAPIARQGEPAPGGGTYRLAFGGILNNRGEVVFIGDLTPAPDFGDRLGVFLHTAKGTIPVARPGDAMPGGGTLVRASFFGSNCYINDRGDVAFDGTLDTDANGDGVADTGLWVWSAASLRLVARTGTDIPGIGTVAHLANPFSLDPTNPLLSASSGALINNRGQVAFQAILTDGRDVLLIATP